MARRDTMTVTFGASNRIESSIRPVAVAEGWLVAAVGQHMRRIRGLPPVPDKPRRPVPKLRPMSRAPAGPPRWATIGEPAVQLTGEDALLAYRLSARRPIRKIVHILSGP